MLTNAVDPVHVQTIHNQKFDAYEFVHLEAATVYKCKAEIHMKQYFNGQ